METRGIDDSVFDFFGDSSKSQCVGETKKVVTDALCLEKTISTDRFYKHSLHQESFDTAVTTKLHQNKSHKSLENESSGLSHSMSMDAEESGDISNCLDYDYEDDFENTSPDSSFTRDKSTEYDSSYSSHPRKPDAKLDIDSNTEGKGGRYRETAKMSPNSHGSKKANSRDMSIYGQYRVSDGGRRQHVAPSSHRDRPIQTEKQTNRRSDSRHREDTRYSPSKKEHGSTEDWDTYSGEFNSFDDDTRSGLTCDPFPGSVFKNDKFSDNPATSPFLLKNNRNEKRNMSFRKKLSLPHVNKAKRVELTRNSKCRDKCSISPEHKSVLRHHPRTHVAMAGPDIARPVPTHRQPIRKQPVPIPLKSEALYYNGELTVNVCGDRRGNPDKNKFNVTITVVHKHMKLHTHSDKSRQAGKCKRRWRNDSLDWDIVKHRAALPGFNTATDPEVNRRYLQQFGI